MVAVGLRIPFLGALPLTYERQGRSGGGPCRAEGGRSRDYVASARPAEQIWRRFWREILKARPQRSGSTRTSRSPGGRFDSCQSRWLGARRRGRCAAHSTADVDTRGRSPGLAGGRASSGGRTKAETGIGQGADVAAHAVSSTGSSSKIWGGAHTTSTRGPAAGMRERLFSRAVERSACPTWIGTHDRAAAALVRRGRR